VTERTGTWITVRLVLPFEFPAVAVIVTVPFRRPVTVAVEMPVETTMAMDVSLLVHVARLLIAPPLAVVTVRLRLWP
jgi:hypothetical protein